MATSTMHPLRSPLARRVVVYTVLFSSLITLALTMIQLYREYRLDRDMIVTHVEQARDSHMGAIREAVWVINEKNLQSQLDGILSVPDMQYVEIRDGDRLWVSAGQPKSANVISQTYSIVQRHRGAELVIGTLSMVASLDGVRQRIIDRAVVILLSNGVKTFFVALFMLFVFHRLLGRHVRHIADYLSSDTDDLRKAPLRLDRQQTETPDELDLLAGNLNRTRASASRAMDALRESEIRYRTLFDLVPIAIWVEDFSRVWERIEELRNRGVTDLDGHLREHPEVLAGLSDLIDVVQVNQRTLDLYGARSLEEFNTGYVYSRTALDMLREELVRFSRGECTYQPESSIEERSLRGRSFDAIVSAAKCESPFAHLILATVTDISKLKKMEIALAERSRRYEGLVQISARMAENIGVDDALQGIAKVAADLMAVDAVGFRLLRNGRLVRVGTSGVADKIMVKESIEAGESLSGIVVQKGRTLVVADIETDLRLDSQHRKAMIANSIKAFLGVPLFYQKRVIGTLNIYGKSQRIFEDNEIELFQAFADHAAVIIEKARLYAELESRTEGLETEVTERKRVETSLSERETRLRLITDGLPILITFMDRELRFQFVNKTAEKWFRRPRAGIEGRHIATILGQNYFEKLRIPLDDALRGNGRTFDTEISYPDGETRNVDVTYVPHRDIEGKVAGVYAMVLDITGRKRIEKELRDSQHRLSMALEEREMLARDLHDGILQTIYATGLGLDDARVQIEETMPEAGAKIAQEIDRLNRVIRELRKHIIGDQLPVLTFKQLRGELEELTRVPGATGRMGIRLDIEPLAASRLPSTMINDFVHIAREAISNSVRHSNGTRGFISLREAGHEVRLIVTDDGVGFDPQVVRRNGSGLTNIVTRAARIGGQLDIVSGQGRGTTITLAVPVTDRTSPA